MYRKFILYSLLILMLSCGKDVVIIEEPIPPIESDVTYEVNIGVTNIGVN